MRNTYSINWKEYSYRNTASIPPFDLCQQDVTEQYCRTSDLEIETNHSIKLKDKYVYIAMAVNEGGPQWSILDFGRMKHGKAHFKNMGRNMLYIALGYEGTKLIPISPFLLKKSSVEYIQNNKTTAADNQRQ